MKKITFKQFMNTFNFRNINDTKRKSNGEYLEDTKIIRIYSPKIYDSFDLENKWIEFGLYDFSTNNYKNKIMGEFLSKEILDSYVDEIRIEDNGEWQDIVKVYLTKDKENNE